MNRKTFVYPTYPLCIILVLCTNFLSACEDDPKPPTATITSPTEAVTVGKWLALSGEESLHPKGEAADLIFEWRLVSSPLGSQSMLVDTDTMTPDIRPDLPGSYEVALIVKTSKVGSEEVYATFEAGPCGAQAPVVSEIMQHPPQPGVNSLVQLYAVAEDPDLSSSCISIEIDDESPQTVSVGDAPFAVPVIAYDLDYQWRMISRPPQSLAELQRADSVTPLFTPDVSGDYHFAVLVTDQQMAVSESTIHIVSVTSCGEGRPSLEITLPESGTSGQAIEVISMVTDADTDCGLSESFQYNWQLTSVPAGSTTQLNDAHLAKPSFIPDLPGEYTITGQVSDQSGYRSDIVSASIAIDTCGTRPPMIMEITARGLSTTEEMNEEEAGMEMAGMEMAGMEMAGMEMAGMEMAGMEMAGMEMPEANWDDSLIHVGEVVSFAAMVSDPDLEEDCNLDARLDYEWSIVRLPAESNATLNRNSARTPSLTADAAGEYTVRLVVRDAQGHASEPMEVDFTVQICGLQVPTGQSTFTPTVPQAGELVSLVAEYTDLDATCIDTTLSYEWRFEALPPGSIAELNDVHAMTPSFMADLPGLYVIALNVMDNTGLNSEQEIIEVNVGTCGSNIPSITSVNHQPLSINAGQAVRFTADVSDFDLDPSCGSRSENFMYHWQLSESPAESQASLSLAQTATPTLLADVPGEYEVSLAVSDSRGFVSNSVQHRVIVGSCGFSAPSMTLEVNNSAPATGDTVIFDATVNDADNTAPCAEAETFSYSWHILEAPAGSVAPLNNPQAKTPSLTVDVPGTYLVACSVTDSTGRSSQEVTLSIVADNCGDNPPQVQSISGEPSPRIGVPARLEVVASDSDNEAGCDLAQSMSYHWRFISIPAGSEARLLNANLNVASFIPDIAGDYTALVEVTDETEYQATAQVTLSVNECGVRAPQVDNLDLSSDDHRVHTPVALSVSVSDVDETDLSCALAQEVNVHWEMVSAPVGSQAQLTASDRLTTSFTPDMPGDYQVRVRAYDQNGLMSSWESQSISINDCGLAHPVIDNITSDGVAPLNVGEVLRFSATVSDTDDVQDCLPNQTHTYHWRIISAPASSMAMLTGSTLTEVDFTPDAPGNYIIGLIVSDDLGLMSAEYRFPFTVDSCGSFAPVVSSISSNSGQAEWDLDVPVRLAHDGYDPDIRDCGLEDNLTYHWALIAKPSGSMAMLNDPSLSEPSLTPDQAGDYKVSVMITDQNGQAAMLTESFTASLCGGQTPTARVQTLAPAQTVVSPLTVSQGETVQLDASTSNDLDDQCGVTTTLSYHWTLLRVPPASQATLSLPNGVTPWFIADEQGLYRIQLIVSDGMHDSDPVVFEVNAN